MNTAVLLETAAPVAAPIDVLLSELRADRIRIPRLPEVRVYLEQFPDLIPAVCHVCDVTLSEFDGKAELSLEVYVDPEIDDPHLMLYVRQESFEPNLWLVFERVQEACADALPADTEGWLHVGPDFRASNRR